MKPDQVRERMEMYEFGRGDREAELFLKEVCDTYEELFYKLVEKEDKVNALNDAVKYYKNMEDNMAQMLSTISEISEKTEKTAEKTAELTIKEAEGKAGIILANASQSAAQILEDAKAEAKELVEGAEGRIEDSKKELAQVKEEINAYAQSFYEFLEMQKTFFEEHKIDVEALPVRPMMPSASMPVSPQPSVMMPMSVQSMPPIMPVPLQPAIQSAAAPSAFVQSQPAPAIQPAAMQSVSVQPQPAAVQSTVSGQPSGPVVSSEQSQLLPKPQQLSSQLPPIGEEKLLSQPEALQEAEPLSEQPQPAAMQQLPSSVSASVPQMAKQSQPSVPPVSVQGKEVAVPEEQAAITYEQGLENVTINQIKKIPNASLQNSQNSQNSHSPTIEEIEARIPENIRNIPISDHTETLDEIIQSIKKSYEEVENRS